MTISGKSPSDAAAAERPSEFSASTTTAEQRRWILIGTCLALLGVMVTVSGLNVAQGALAADIGASQSQLLWIINGFNVALAATLLPLGAMGDRLGRRSVLLVGLAAFSVTNIAAAFATGPWVLVGLRITTGVAAAMIMPATLSTITSSFPAEERGKAIGIWSGVAGGGGVIGLLSSAVLIDLASWQWVFAAPVGIAVAAAVITLTHVPDTKETVGGAFDRGGSLLSILGIGGLVLGIQEGPEQGWTAGITVAALAVGVTALIGFVQWERRHDQPLLDMSIFSNRTLSAATLLLGVMFALIIGMFVVMVQFLQAVLGLSAIRASLGLLPMIVMLMFWSPIAPKIAGRLGYRATMTACLAVIAGALAWLATIGSDPSYIDVFPALAIIGAALGIAMTPSTEAITESLPSHKQGVASALNDTIREFGGAVGLALIGSILAAGQLGADGEALIESAKAAFLDGWGTTMWMASGIAFLTAIVAAALIPADKSAPTAKLPVEELVGA